MMSNPVDPTTFDPQSIFDFNKAQPRISSIVTEFDPLVKLRVDGNRRLRNVDISIQQLRDSNQIATDETFIPARVIDMNIRREAPLIVRYLTEPNRLVVFKDVADQGRDTSKLESDYSVGMRYPGWLKDIYRTWDGAAVHGWDAVEVLLDTTRPLHVFIDHISTDNLIIPTKTKNIQNCEMILRRFKFSALQLKEATSKYNFDTTQVAQILAKTGEKYDNTLFDVYKMFFKQAGQVFVAWLSLKDCQDWLKKPEGLYLGRDSKSQAPVMSPPVPHPVTGELMPPSPMIDPMTMQPMMQDVWTPIIESSYPVFILDYILTEEDNQCEQKGRVFLDSPKQEANTTVLTSWVNGVVRASQVYGSPDSNDIATGAIKQLEVELEPRRMYDRKINFWSTPYPEATVLQGLQFLDVFNSQEVGQVNFAAQNRADTEKTATEIKAASETSQELSSVSVALFSMWWQSVHNFIWLIVQSRAIKGVIPLLVKSVDTTQQPPLYKNDVELLSKIYLVFPAGDTDVIQRMQRLQKKMSFWPIVSNTPLAVPFLKSMLMDAFPNEGPQFCQLLDQAQTDKNLIMALWQVVQKEASEDASEGQLTPQDKAAIAQLGQLVQQSTGAAPQQPQQGQQGPPTNGLPENSKPVGTAGPSTANAGPASQAT